MTDKIREYVSEKTTYYMPKYENMKLNGKKVSWNWAAFLVPHYWMAYRKMYVESCIYLVVWKLISLLSDFVVKIAERTGNVMLALTLLIVMLVSNIAFLVVFPMFANYYYLNKLERLAQEEDTMTDGQINSQHHRYAGVNKAAVWIMLAVTLLCNIILG